VDGTRSALIIASDQYSDPGLRRLRAPAADAQALASVLREPEIGAFEVRTLLNEPAHEVNLAVEEFFAERRADDLLLMHFSCHGIKDEDGELYFAMTNTRLRRLAATAVAAEFVNRRMGRSRSRRVVLLLDCCYAGAFERGMTARAGPEMGIEQQFSGRGRAVITASSAMEYAFENDDLADTRELAPSVFTSALVQGLETGDADRDQDGLIALDELYEYVYDKVRAATPNQTPGKWTFGVQGELVIARRRRPVATPAPLPPALQDAIDSPLAAVRVGAVQELTSLLRGRHAGLALAARLALERLTENDSRAVAAAASAALGVQAKPSALPEPAPPEPGRPPLPGPGAAATGHPEAVPDIPPGALPVAQENAALAEGSPAPAATTPPLTVPATAPSTTAGTIAAWSALRPFGADYTAPQARSYRRLLAAGGLAIAGAVLMVADSFPSFQFSSYLAVLTGDLSGTLGWPIIITAAVCLIAGGCIFRPSAGPLIGPGLLIGAAAAATSVLVFSVGDLTVMNTVMNEAESAGFWLQFAASLILVTAACLAGVTLRRATEVRLVRWPPHSALAWVVVLLGVAGALALGFEDRIVAGTGGHFGAAGEFLASSIWLTVMALVVPACAAVAVSRQFGVALLAGWIAGGAALALFSYDLLDNVRAGLTSQADGSHTFLKDIGVTLPSYGPLIAFGLTLLALSVVAAFFARAAASTGPELIAPS
jgi:hypothetical protein